MASKFKRIIKQPRMIVLLIFVAISLFMIPNIKPAGVAVAYVTMDSPFYQKLEADMLITAVNGIAVKTIDDYTAQISKAKIGDNISISTKDVLQRATLQEDPRKPGAPYIGVNVKTTKSTNFEQGLDLQGGARVVLRPVPADEEAPVNDTLIDTTASVLMARMNAYGLKNVVVRQIKDVNGLSFIEVAMAGEGSESVVDIVKSVGLFELKVLNETVLTGEYIVPPIGEPQQDMQSGLWQVAFAINNEGARIFRESYVKMAPQSVQVPCTSDSDCNASYACSRDVTHGQCLPRIEMFLDNALQYSAPPAQSLYQTWLYGEDSKNLQVQTNKFEDAQKVKIVLEAGRLPKDVKELRVYSQDYVDPKLGKNFTRGALLAGLASIFAVLIVVFIRYRALKVVIPVMLFDLAELTILLGFAAIIKWSLDLPGIAGIIAVIGTAVNQQIIMTDQVRSGETAQYALKKNVKTAFGIMVASASTVIASMLPLAYPGFTGLYALRGFAIVTILGLLIGLFITRPAFAKVAEILYGEE